MAVDAYESRDVEIVDVSGAYLHTDMSQTEGKIVQLKLKGDFVDIMCSVNEEFTPHVVYEGKTKVYTWNFYVQSIVVLNLQCCGTIYM